MRSLFLRIFLLSVLLLSACDQGAGPGSPSIIPPGRPHVLAIETFLGDIAQNVAGDRLTVDVLIPAGTDPHSFEPTPLDAARVDDSTVLIVNGAKLEEFLGKLLVAAGRQQLVIEASAGLTSRTPSANEILDPDHQGDPHFWLDPNNTVRYVENIRAGLSQADPQDAPFFARNAQAYTTRLKDLDGWIRQKVAMIPAQRRLLVTNHESLGYFAGRYGFRIVGTIIPSVTSGASPSARELAQLADQIRQTGAPAIFLETGSNPRLAEQLSSETGIKVVSDLYTHSISGPGGPAPTYIEMMKYNVNQIVEALK